MNSFLQAFSEGLDEDVKGGTSDESPASRVNVVLRSARRYIAAPERERACFEREFDAFESGIDQALTELEGLFPKAKESEQILLEMAHASLEVLLQQVDALERLFEEPSDGLLDQIAQDVLLPTYRLLLTKEALENLASFAPCPYCQSDNQRPALRCESCGKPLTVPDPLKQEGELFPVPPTVSQLLQHCFQVARDPDQHLPAWEQHLRTVQSQFEAARTKVQEAQKSEESGSPVYQDFADMDRGLGVLLAGLDELASYKDACDARVLDTGWVNMMSGFKIFKQAGDRMASRNS